MKLHYIDISILALYLMICLAIGLYRSTKIKTLHQFALGYKDITSTTLICTIFASVTGAGATLGAAEKAYLFGVVFVIRQLFAPVGWLITSYIICPAIEKFKDCLTISQIMYQLYGPFARYITTLATMVASIGAVLVQATAMGYLFHYFFGIQPIYGMLIGYSILTIYSILGGIRAVIVTEVFKFIIFFTVVPISYVFASAKVGGFTNLLALLPDSYFHFSFTKENILLILTLVFYFIFPRYDAPFIQRCLIAQNAAQLKSCFRHIALLSLPFSVSFCAIAYIVKAYAPYINSKDIVFYYIEYYLPIGLQGVMIAGLLATMMSLAESQISSASIILTNDLVNPLFPKLSSSKQLFLLRSLILLLSGSSILVVSASKDLMSIAWLVFNFYDPIISIPLAAGFLGFRTTNIAFIANTIFAVAFTLIGRLYAGEFAITSFCFGITGSVIGFFGAHYILKALGLFHVFALVSNERMNIKSILKRKVSSSINRVAYNFKKRPTNNRYKEFCIFTLSAYFIYSFYLCFFSYSENLLYLVIIGYFLCLILLAREVIFASKFLKKYLHVYWHLILIYCLPFVSNYMLFVSEGDDFWVINGIFAAVSLYFFVDSLLYIILYSTGALCAFIWFMFTNSADHSLVPALGSVAYVLVFIILTSIMFLRSREKEQEEKVETMHLFGGAMAHEVKSPLATLNMCAQQLNILINKVVETKVEKGGYTTLNLQNKDISLLVELGSVLTQVSKSGVKTVEGLLTSLKSSIVADDKGVYKISKVISLAVKEYTSLHSLDDRLEVNIIQDFEFFGSLHYTKHVLFNLFTNAQRYGGIHVYITITAEDNTINFRDNGKGISESDIPHIFNKFYTQGRTGTGIGLSFCKMVMEDMGGTISCKSQVGQFTEFALYFPRFKKELKLS
jgi:Na+/proline symporter/signal transduction histidine kinase